MISKKSQLLKDWNGVLLLLLLRVLHFIDDINYASTEKVSLFKSALMPMKLTFRTVQNKEYVVRFLWVKHYFYPFSIILSWQDCSRKPNNFSYSLFKTFMKEKPRVCWNFHILLLCRHLWPSWWALNEAVRGLFMDSLNVFQWPSCSLQLSRDTKIFKSSSASRK